MSEFLPSTIPVLPVASALERGPIVRAPAASQSSRSKTEADAASTPVVTDSSRAAADYAKIQADIADVLASIEPASPRSSDIVDIANDAVVALMPSPVIVLPLPPTDPQIVAFVAQVAQSVARQAAQTRAAQANATPLLAEAAAG